MYINAFPFNYTHTYRLLKNLVNYYTYIRKKLVIINWQKYFLILYFPQNIFDLHIYLITASIISPQLLINSYIAVIAINSDNLIKSCMHCYASAIMKA